MGGINTSKLCEGRSAGQDFPSSQHASGMINDAPMLRSPDEATMRGACPRFPLVVLDIGRPSDSQMRSQRDAEQRRNSERTERPHTQLTVSIPTTP